MSCAWRARYVADSPGDLPRPRSFRRVRMLAEPLVKAAP